MRQVVSLSLPAADARQMKNLTKKRGFGSVSSYIKHLFKEDADSVSEAELLKTVRAARREYRAGKSIKARSLADLV
ncbi:MAG: hypothetical protein HY983_02435 [Candidatus Magasanikbacteria bacterium]|nr:hypothetical protein [Candidatus Magasanikbacteria bacterium]